jgi:hypothetical protein
MLKLQFATIFVQIAIWLGRFTGAGLKVQREGGRAAARETVVSATIQLKPRMNTHSHEWDWRFDALAELALRHHLAQLRTCFTVERIIRLHWC